MEISQAGFGSIGEQEGEKKKYPWTWIDEMRLSSLRKRTKKRNEQNLRGQ